MVDGSITCIRSVLAAKNFLSLLSLLLLFIFRIVTDIQHINAYFAGYYSWSFHLGNIAVTYDLNAMNISVKVHRRWKPMKTYIIYT